MDNIGDDIIWDPTYYKQLHQIVRIEICLTCLEKLTSTWKLYAKIFI